MLRKSHEIIKNRYVNRREFLKISGMLGAGVATSSLGMPLAEAIKFDKNLYKVSRSLPYMGTMVSMTVLDPSKDRGEEAISMAFNEIERLVKIMNRFDAGTPLYQLNSEGFLHEVPPELSYLINKSKYYNQLSNGLFDITIKPVLDFFAQSFKKQQNLSYSEKKIKGLLRLVDSKFITTNGRSIGFKRDGMQITLDGIAKGYIVDKSAKKLSDMGIKHALINAGGDISAIGGKENNRPWKIAIEDPLKKKNYPSVVSIKNGSIATSGNYEVFFDKEKVFHHIINPETGLSPLTNVSVSIQAPTTMEADALSTAVFLLDPVPGTKLINSLPSCRSFIVTKNQRKIKSNGWQGSKI